jgi:site-specific DNA recombinase
MALAVGPTQLLAAIYARVSTLAQKEHGFSLEAQDKDCRALAAELSATVVATYVDNDSGADWDLPQLNAMLDAARRGEFTILLVYDPDRLARNMAKQLVIEEELKRYGVTIQYVGLRLGDSPEDRLLKNVRASISEYEREKIRMRTARGRREKAERGQVVGTGPAPYGYCYIRNEKGSAYALATDPDTSPVAVRIWAEVAEYPLGVVADRLNAEGIPPPRGAKAGWSTAALLAILHNPVYLGQAAYGRRDAAWRVRDTSLWLLSPAPPLVDQATWDAAHEALRRRKQQRPARMADDPYTLRGLLTCGHCGGPLACQAVYEKRYYLCLRAQPRRAGLQARPLCPSRSIPAEALEPIAWETVAATLLDPEHLRAGLDASQAEHAEAHQRRQERLETIDREVARLRTRFDRITDERLDAAPGTETERALRAKAEEAEAAITRLLAGRAELVAAPSVGITPEESMALEEFAAEVRAGVACASVEEQQRVYRLLKLTGTATRDEAEGKQLGRYRYSRFVIEWRALLPLAVLPHGGNKFRK